mgnify:CR=1|tara:strand:- start:4068 stop:4628 length:561 start_codon:yes stop_codon:yes gene_type:complete
MKTKDQLRKRFLILRKKRYFDVPNNRFYHLVDYIRKKHKFKKKLLIALYYPSNYELNIFKILKYLKKKEAIFLLPVIQEENVLKFIRWKERDVLSVNKFGIPEPLQSQKSYLPDVVLVPLLAFDKNKNRLGYGKGFYDRFLNNLIERNHKVEAIGVAFSFQKYNKIPSSKFDFKLHNIFTEKGFLQ